MSQKPLIIVESPNKLASYRKYAPECIVEASVGHIRDLPGNKIGLDDNLEPIYVETKPDVISKLKNKANGRQVILMTDPDREGEAIAYHLYKVLGLTDSNYLRCVTQEITSNGIKKALSNPRKIDFHMVRAQEARRVVDRLVGFKISPISKAVIGAPSVGRVQSTALRLLVDRHRLIQSFSRKPYFELEAYHPGETNELVWKSDLDFAPLINSGKFNQYLAEMDPNKPADKQERRINHLGFMQAIQKQLFTLDGFTVTHKVVAPQSSNPPSPFTTSLLLQGASTTLGWLSDQTMKIAQSLFEKGFISYHRTDSVELASESIEEVRKYIRNWQETNNLTGYLPASPVIHRVSEHAQAGHEAIRPNDYNANISALNTQETELYKLIKNQTIASQMSPAQFEKTTVTLDSTLALNGVPLLFTSIGRIRIFDGWQAVIESKDNTNDLQHLPPVAVGDTCKLINIQLKRKFTKAPSRFTEASLIRELEKREIGRPSTYASIMSTIRERRYTKYDDKFIDCSPLGIKLINSLENKFLFLNYDYTANVERSLDKIAHEILTFHDVVHQVDIQLKEETEAFLKSEDVQKHFQVCPSCHAKTLTRQRSKQKKIYYLCINQNVECGKLFFENEGKLVEAKDSSNSLTTQTCPKCNKKHLYLTGYKPDKKQRYWYCPDKKCSFICSSIQETANTETPKPDFEEFILSNKFPCPNGCNTMLKRHLNAKTGEYYFKCHKCNTSYKDRNKQPVIEKIPEELLCPVCKKRKLIKAKSGKTYFCSGAKSQGCKTFVPVNEETGKPDFDAWKKEQESKGIHFCPNCNKPLKFQPNKNQFICSDYGNCKTIIKAYEGKPDYRDLETRQKRPFI